MIKALVTALLLSLALSGPISAATSPLSANPSPVNFGSIVVGSCDLETFVGCNIKVVTIHARVRTKIGGWGVSSPVGDVGLAPNSRSNACGRLTDGVLRAGKSCSIKVAMAPVTKAPIERYLTIWNPSDIILLHVALRAEGV